MDSFVAWYGTLPAWGQLGLNAFVGAIIAAIVFAIVMKLVKKIITRIIVTALAFLLTTVPGNLIMQNAVTHLENQVGTHLDTGGTYQR